jgi:hypothetical protein
MRARDKFRMDLLKSQPDAEKYSEINRADKILVRANQLNLIIAGRYSPSISLLNGFRNRFIGREALVELHRTALMASGQV